MAEAKHDQAVALLTGLERFVRLVVEREIPLSQANPANLITPSEKSPHVIGVPKPYTGLYSPNSYMANRPGYASYRRSMDADKSLSPNSTANTPPPIKSEPINGVSKMNGDSENMNAIKSPTSATTSSITSQSHPQPAPRYIVSQSTTTPSTNSDPTPSTNADSTPTPNSAPTGTPEPRSSSPQEDIQVAKPITNEEFQAMIPAHFLRPPTSSPSPDSHQGPVVTVTIKQPENLPGDVSFPPAPTTLGKVTETITKSTLTETVVTRVTDNHLVLPVIIEVCPG